ncbi:HBS1-like protein [Vitis vinifera]|uniref:HBS1-like protein n=1 Tax=Vitis vinifera TaxID=29760 RepID=A0A438IQC3_VITVI|nr:HBS1-like protein [Vitis vinifera]
MHEACSTNLTTSVSSEVPSRVIDKHGLVNKQSSAKRSDRSSDLMPKGRHENVGDTDFSESGAAIQSQVLKSSSAGKSVSDVHYKPEKWMILIKKRCSDSIESCNCKKTATPIGTNIQKEMHKYEKEAKLQGKGSFAYAWALDESTEERERGITMTVAVAYFDSKKYHVVVLDSPGVDSTGGQTREHAQLIRSFGVDQIIVAVNKMDAVEYSKERFDFIKCSLELFSVLVVSRILLCPGFH